MVANGTGADKSANQMVPPIASENLSSRRRLLLVAYQFPPVGGAGVQRVTKFTKFLPQFGWDVSVLTVDNPSVPVFDDALLRDVPESTAIYRARTLEPSYESKAKVADANAQLQSSLLQRIRQVPKKAARRAAIAALQPDAQVLWNWNARRVGRRLLTQVKHHAILASGPPFSSFLLGRNLAKVSGLPLILDYRDEWEISNRYWENRRVGPIAARLHKWMQTRVISASSALIGTTSHTAEQLERQRIAASSRATVHCLYNGYDLDDFQVDGVQEESSSEFYSLAYVGTLWNLTTILPLCSAIEQIKAATPNLLNAFRLVVAGRRTEAEQGFVDRLLRLGVKVEQHPYLTHADAVKLMRCSHELAVILADVPSAERVLPAKVFEYMAAGRPILGIAPAGELTSVLMSVPSARVFAPKDVSSIASHLARRLACYSSGIIVANAPISDSRFERKTQASQLASILNQVALLK